MIFFLDKMNFDCPNWHIGLHWTQMVKLFGMPINFSTARFEAKHQELKQWYKLTNKQSFIEDICYREIKNELIHLLWPELMASVIIGVYFFLEIIEGFLG